MQLRAGEGPCLEAFHTGQVIVVHDAAEAARQWPQWSRTRDRDLFASVLAVPLHHGETHSGRSTSSPGSPAPSTMSSPPRSPM